MNKLERLRIKGVDHPLRGPGRYSLMNETARRQVRMQEEVVNGSKPNGFNGGVTRAQEAGSPVKTISVGDRLIPIEEFVAQLGKNGSVTAQQRPSSGL